MLIKKSSLIQVNTFISVQTGIRDPSTEPSADDFLAREKAILGDDAIQFASPQDSSAMPASSLDLLGGASGETQPSFEYQFPEIGTGVWHPYPFILSRRLTKT